jgi:subtilase family serine protease
MKGIRAVLASAALAGAVVLAGCTTGADVGGPNGNDTSDWQALSVSAPTWASAASYLGPANASDEIDVHVYLKLRNEATATAELAAISDPHNTRYRQFLTGAQFSALYGPTPEMANAVSSHLASFGLQVSYVPGNRAYVAAHGTVAQASAAFGTPLGRYQVGGEVRRAPTSAARLPRSIASGVMTLLGLATPTQMQPHNIPTNAPLAGVNPDDGNEPLPCSEWFGQTLDTTDPPFAPGWPTLGLIPCPYRPAQLRSAFGLSKQIRGGLDGTGISIGIVDAYLSPTLVQDAQTYFDNNDLDYPLPTSQISVQMGPGTAQTPDPGWYYEQSLDVESIHSMAPGANIVYVGGQSNQYTDMAAAINYIMDNGLADIISNSYGSIEAQTTDQVVYHAVALQAGLRGVGLYFSSGDHGDNAVQNSGNPSPDFPASLDIVTAVGGTSMALDQNGQVLFQVGWEDAVSRLEAGPDGGTPSYVPAAPGSYYEGAGGGTSGTYLQPSYQAGVVPAALANLPGVPSRVMPDVASLADPYTGFLIGITDPTAGVYIEAGYGGTSLACPLFAATMALAEQNAGHSFGFANPLLYSAYNTPAFIDIVPGASPNGIIFPSTATRGAAVLDYDFQGLTINTAVGYDNVTGIGVPNGQSFLDAIQ